ncbi:(2Fe-2S)-binding protein [Verticiella sediminum]|uniref:(2Fe-2S)-binding protein n=1 Tax=Verticiella sediminum TaxID=1247510 RepID=A0A556AYQ5_9BURK|nr:(2Fe-2S)-binding protein [Verticiella sediminum]TSH98073.1 (2Fe-2S)-binding protein [Verticiella sediminum]
MNADISRSGPAPDTTLRLALQLNGQPVALECRADTRLLTLLREHWCLTGAKPGCGIGRCGACMVWLDEVPVNACLVMAYQLQGRSVRTIESVAADVVSLPVRQALAEQGAVQCGYCTAGVVMTLTWLHRQPAAACREQARAAMCGNLCRCTGYTGLERAVAQLFPG